MADNIFNGSDSYVGFIDTYTGENASLTISKISGGAELKAPFLVSSFAMQFGRSIQTRDFLNVKGKVAVIGSPQGSLTLSGLLGEADDFAEFIGGADTGACDLLTITIDASNGYKTCAGAGAPARTVTTPCKFVCSGALVTNFSTTGSVEGGITMIQGNVAIQFTKLQIVKG